MCALFIFGLKMLIESRLQRFKLIESNIKYNNKNKILVNFTERGHKVTYFRILDILLMKNCDPGRLEVIWRIIFPMSELVKKLPTRR